MTTTDYTGPTGIGIRKTELLIKIAPNDIDFHWWNKLKTHVWNFILPPHIRLVIPPRSKGDKS